MALVYVYVRIGISITCQQLPSSWRRITAANSIRRFLNVFNKHGLSIENIFPPFPVLFISWVIVTWYLCYVSCYLLMFNSYFSSLVLYHIHLVSRDSSVGIATGYGMDGREVGVRVPTGSEISLLHVVQMALGSTHPPIQWVPGAFSPKVKRPELEADHSRPASTEIKKIWIYTSTAS
jgi:hypothetical protein